MEKQENLTRNYNNTTKEVKYDKKCIKNNIQVI